MNTDVKSIVILALLLIGAVWMFSIWYRAPESVRHSRGRLLFYCIVMLILAVIFIFKMLGIHVPMLNP
jgi:hypothetical protein